MTKKDNFLALLIAVVWGFNFVPMKWGLDFLSPLMLGAARFFFVAFPLIFFIKAPKVPFRYVAMYGLLSVFLQFTFTFGALALGLSPGIASVVLQTQVIFTIVLGVLFLAEIPSKKTIICLIVASFGLVIIGLASDNKTAPLLGLVAAILAAVFWSTGNIIIRKIINKGYQPDMLAMMVWSSALLPIPFIILSLLLEDNAINMDAFNLRNVISILFLSYVASIFGYTAWSLLLTRYHAGLVSPYSLMVPVFGIFFSFLFFKDAPSLLQWLGILVIFVGLVTHVLSTLKPSQRSRKDE